MNWSKNKLLLALFVAGVAIIASFWMRSHPKKINQADLVIKITQGYVQQFCNIIYPNISNCVTLSVDECANAAKETIELCIGENSDNLQGTHSQTEAQKIYNVLGECFANKMHDLIMQRYLLDTPECRQKLN